MAVTRCQGHGSAKNGGQAAIGCQLTGLSYSSNGRRSGLPGPHTANTACMAASRRNCDEGIARLKQHQGQAGQDQDGRGLREQTSLVVTPFGTLRATQ